MKTKEEIESRLESCNDEAANLKEWYEKACENYKKDRSFWGKDADDGEMRYASDELSKVTSEIKILKWVLNI